MKRAGWFALVCLLGAGGIVPPAGAAIYYVNNSGTPACGDAAGRGTLAQPFCTIGYALSRIGGGDTVYVRSGTYNENLYVAGPAGREGAHTTLAAYPGDTVILRGGGVNTGRCKIANTSYLTFQGFRITNYNQGLFVETADHVLVKDCSIYLVGQEGLHVHYNSFSVTVEDCTVHDTRQWQYNGEGIYLGTGDSAPVDSTRDVTIRRCTVYNTPDEGIELKIGTHGVVVEGSTFYNVNQGSDWSQNGNDVGAVEVNQAVGTVQRYAGNPGHIIRNNFIHDVKTAVRAGTGCQVYNNVIWDVSGYGIYVDNQSGDSYTRFLYHNTIDAAPAAAVFRAGGAYDLKNNIGPTAAGNLAASAAYFASVAEGSEDYHLTAGAAPVDAGLDAGIATDRDGRRRDARPDMGAYEYVSSRVQAAAAGGARLWITVSGAAADRWRIEYEVPRPETVKLEVFTPAGKRVRTLVDGPVAAGSHVVSWLAGGCPAGVYLYRLSAGRRTVVAKGVVIK